MSSRLFQLFFRKCRTPPCSVSFWVGCGVSSALRYCRFSGMCSNAHVCDPRHFLFVPQLSVPENTGSGIILGSESPRGSDYRFYLVWLCLSMYLHQYINILIHINCHNSGLNWIKGLKLNLFSIAYFDSNLLQNNSQCGVFQSCYS